MVFAPGQSGNPGGRPKEKPFRDALRMEALADQDAPVPKRSLRAIARALLLKAANGDVPAIKEVGDRLDGKAVQAIVGDDEHDPVRINRIERVIVDPQHPDS
jgi:hypothetical protein